MRFNVFLSKEKIPEGIRRLLKKLGPTWLSTPHRRCIQTLCLILFLILFFYFCWPYRYDYSRENTGQIPEVWLFLVLDALVSISTTIAARTLVWSLAVAVIVLLIGIIFPRWFCGYICPLGTMVDLFDWGIGRRIIRFRLKKRGWWVNLRFYLLTFTLIAATFGIMLAGFVAAMPVATRGMLYIFAPLQLGLLKGWDFVPQMNTGHYISIILFLTVFGLGFLRPRFWCAYLCPSGALLSLIGLLHLHRRKVEATCIECSRCLYICPFDSIGSDFNSRSIDCANCRSCQGVCPKQSIKFVGRWNNVSIKTSAPHTNAKPSTSRRRFLFGSMIAIGSGTAAGIAILRERSSYAESYPIRPPGSLPEDRFRRQCVRCGECVKVCPGNVLQPAGFELGIDGIWMPKITADWSGCVPFCNNCGQVCPTGAIRNLSLDEKRAARIGLAEVNKKTCLPHAQRDNCGLCVSECAAAGYNAIEFIRIGGLTDELGMSIGDSGYLAPVVLEDRCIGCGLCQARCYAVNVRDKKLLSESAVKVSAGPGKEDRIVTGSYRDLRDERINRTRQQQPKAPDNEYLPDFLR